MECLVECLAEICCHLFCAVVGEICVGVCESCCNCNGNCGNCCKCNGNCGNCCKCNGNCENCCKCTEDNTNAYGSTGFEYNQVNKSTYVDTYRPINYDINRVNTTEPTRTYSRMNNVQEQDYSTRNQRLSHPTVLSDSEIIFGPPRPEGADTTTSYSSVNNAITTQPERTCVSSEQHEQNYLIRDNMPVPQPTVLSGQENLLRPLGFGVADTTTAYSSVNNATTSQLERTYVPNERHEQNYLIRDSKPVPQPTVLSEEEELLRPLRFGGANTTTPYTRSDNDGNNITAIQPARTVPSAPREENYYPITNIMPVLQVTVPSEEERLLRPLRFGGTENSGNDLPPSYEEATKNIAVEPIPKIAK
ncbi:hypothetical protein ILUMI_03251 [Ignelater luminosus]|uniref:Uncharacterized protein n=1 Tax=Ignelater luminosus TaxID=2038154 RepID=A0A8K0GFN8_IGNLU|nr:hypothetical protein ILUMI_03251 [Ignelater luminosus]